MQHAGRNSVDASHPDHLRGMEYGTSTYGTNDPSFTATATSIRLKWRRDSAKRDAKQVYIYIAPVVTAKRTIPFRYEKPYEIHSDKSFLKIHIFVKSHASLPDK